MEYFIVYFICVGLFVVTLCANVCAKIECNWFELICFSMLVICKFGHISVVIKIYFFSYRFPQYHLEKNIPDTLNQMY